MRSHTKPPVDSLDGVFRWCERYGEVMRAHPTSKETPVFVVDDSMMLTALLKDALIAHGIGDDIRVFNDGPKFLAAYSAFVADGERAKLIVVDIMMPGLDGIVVGQTVRDIEIECGVAASPLVFFSSRARNQEIDDAVAACFPARFIAKDQSEGPAAVALAGTMLFKELTEKSR